MVNFEWNELRRLVKEINDSEFLTNRFQYNDGKKHIRGRRWTEITADLREYIGHLRKLYDDWKSGLPPKIIEWYLDDQEERQVVKPGLGNFVRLPFWLIDDGHLTDLTPTEWMVLTIIARFAYFGSGIREEAGFKIRHGETFVSAAKIAEKSGMCESNVRKAISGLVKKEHIVVIDRQWDGKRNLCLRVVAFMEEMRDDN